MDTNAASTAINLVNHSPFDLSKRFLIANGSPILPRNFKQPVDSAKALHDFAKASEADFLAEMNKISRALKIPVQYPGVKSIERIAQKAEIEKDGDVSQVFDAQRIAFLTSRPSQIKRMIEFFSPNKNSAVVDMINEFAVPDAESRIRRAKIVYNRPGSMLSEIQIWSTQMLNAFEESHVSYNHQRKLKAELQTSGSDLPFKTYNQLQAKERILGQTRCAIHDDAAAEAGLDRFLEKRTFGRIGNTPIVAIETGADPYPTILRPNLKSGLYIADNSLYADFVSERYVKTSRDDFLIASHTAAINHAMKMTLAGHELPVTLAHYKNLELA